jgi:hypothetical protein
VRKIFRLKSAIAACAHGFHSGDFSGYEAIKQHNDSILSDVYKRVQYELSEYAYITTGDSAGGAVYVISRDPQYVGAVRVSVFIRYGCNADARFYPSSHKTFKRVKDLLDYGIPSGRLFVVGGWYDDMMRGVNAAAVG